MSWPGTRTGWEVIDGSVVPQDDLKPHKADDPDCWCRPFWNGDVMVHQSMDGREKFEQGGKVS